MSANAVPERMGVDRNGVPTTAATAPAAVPSTGKDAQAKPGRKLSKKMLIIILVVLAAGGFFGYKKMKPAKPQPPEPGAVVSLDPTTLNLAGNHYLKIALDLRLVLGKASPDDFAKGLAQQLVISEFSNHTVQSLASNKARDQLQKDLAKKIKKAYPDEIYQVYLTQFVTQ
jgi:flagellar FliL protein